MDFEFNQKQCTPGTSDTDCSGNDLTPKRTAYDVLIKYDLAQGGTHPDLGYHYWVTQASAQADPDIPNTAAGACEASNSFPCWGKVISLSGFFEGSINDPTNNPTTGEVTDPINPDAPRTLSARTFGEAAINLTDSGILPGNGSCEGFGSAYLKSRSSDSFTAALKDFIAPLPVNISNCGSINIVKKDDAGNLLGGAVFTLYVDDPGTTAGEKGSAQGGTQADQSDDAQDVAVSPAKTCTTESSGANLGKCTISNVPAGFYWIVETTGITGYNLAPDQSVQVTVGQTTTAADFINPKLFKVIVLVCQKTDDSLYAAKVAFDAGSVPSSANSPTSVPTGIDETKLCQLSGTYVHDDVTRAGNDHTSTIRIP
jgi:hypothetical protein